MDKLHVIFTRGIQGSGKSTWAKKYVKENQNYKRVCRDDLRHMLSSYTFDDKNENLVTPIEYDIVWKCLQEGYNVVIDAMHLNPKYIPNWKTLIDHTSPKVEFEVKDFPCTLEEAIDPSHIREGCVFRFEKGNKFEAYKSKNFNFKVLEGIIKDSDVVDIEEAQENI